MTEAPEGRGIAERLVELARREPEREMIVDPGAGRHTYAEIAHQVERLALGLRGLGLGPGDIAIVQLPNWVPFVVFHLALSAIGAVTVNIPLVFGAREVGNILRLTGAKALAVPSNFRNRDFATMAEAARADAPDLSHVFLVGGGAAAAAPATIDYDSFMTEPWENAGGWDGLAALAPTTAETTVLGFTSGTTGEQKGAMLSTDNFRAWNMGLVERYGLDADERIFACSPLGHAVGFAHVLRMTLTLGCAMVLLDHWDPARALGLIEEERCTFMAGATPFLMDLVYHPGLADTGGLPSLRLFLCGGASVPEQLMRDAQAALPHTFTSPLWGMTECGGVTTCPFEAPPEKLFTTDGVACGDMELKVVDPGGRTVEAGEDGELMARGSMVAKGYFERPELTAEHFLADGFFRTGDRARMDRDGYIKITGRIKDIIIRGGVNISPVEIENLLFSHPKVANVAVVGMPDARLGERVCAFVVPKAKEAPDLGEVQRWMSAAGVAKPKWPERIEAIDALPMTPSGKVQKFRLREIIAARLGGQG